MKPTVIFIDRDKEDITPDLDKFHEFFESVFFKNEREYQKFLDTPLEEAEKRDVKGLYAKARRGELPNFTGIDSPYEAPENPEIRLDTKKNSIEESVADIVKFLKLD